MCLFQWWPNCPDLSHSPGVTGHMSVPVVTLLSWCPALQVLQDMCLFQWWPYYPDVPLSRCYRTCVCSSGDLTVLTCPTLQVLQDRCLTRRADEVGQLFMEDFGRSHLEVFAEFSPVPVAAASLAQVFSATTHDGEKVRPAAGLPYPFPFWSPQQQNHNGGVQCACSNMYDFCVISHHQSSFIVHREKRQQNK